MLRLCKFNGLLTKSKNVPTISLVSHINMLNRRALSSSPVLCSKIESALDEQIYAGALTKQIRMVKVFSLTTSMAGLAAQPFIISEGVSIGSTSLLVAMCSVVGFFTFVTPLLLHFITKKYVIRLDYNAATSTFTATTITFFCTQKELQFKPEDVVVPDITGMFTTFQAKGKALFVEARHFSDPSLYAKLMGYDKPMDFKLGNAELDEKPK